MPDVLPLGDVQLKAAGAPDPGEAGALQDPPRQFGFADLPDSMLLKIFSAIEATSLCDASELEDMTTQLYEEVTDDFLTVLVDGYQKRCGLPMVCKRWKACLSQPSYVWAYLNIDFHELWNVQQRFVDRDLLFSWIRHRQSGIKHMMLEFDRWTRQYYQGAFSAVQASRSMAALLQILRPSLEQLKISDSGFVVNPTMLQSLATATHIQHLQLFGVSSHVLVSDALTAITCLTQLRNLELADNDDHRTVVQQQHPSFFPTQICNLPNLITLHIQSPLVTCIAASIQALSKLRTLVIDGSSLEEVASVLVDLPHLHTLCLADNACLAAGKAPDEWWPAELTQFTSLNKLNLSCCGISGVPVPLGRLAVLSHLDLSANNSGPGIMLPLEVGDCNAIRSLQMRDCSLHRVPDCLCRLTAMEYLNLANNQLAQLPESISDLKQLCNIDLAHNLFLSFPTQLAHITNLARISFKGCTDMQIPEPLGMLSSLCKLTALIFTCDLTRHEPRWSADSTSNLISLALEFAVVHGRDTKIMRL